MQGAHGETLPARQLIVQHPNPMLAHSSAWVHREYTLSHRVPGAPEVRNVTLPLPRGGNEPQRWGAQCTCFSPKQVHAQVERPPPNTHTSWASLPDPRPPQAEDHPVPPSPKGQKGMSVSLPHQGQRCSQRPAHCICFSISVSPACFLPQDTRSLRSQRVSLRLHLGWGC